VLGHAFGPKAFGLGLAQQPMTAQGTGAAVRAERGHQARALWAAWWHVRRRLAGKLGVAGRSARERGGDGSPPDKEGVTPSF
jgi:L,D-peptidoglycan transpeptidase YkuD (ErfK/YbiS/YcfS/YnhG family)